ncbi:MAG: hypothetical protein EPN85_10835 [Bacteroidetes bacterium]|nr:MAG: hypothetical protein EPN85_10835 [Bacteroidota bacterium]
MRSIIILLSVPVLGFSQPKQISMQKITFPASDGLIVTADMYTINDTLPYMVLCHQARYSRGEYMETVKEFITLGYNCLVPDARSGKEVNGVYNETASLAAKKGLPGEYLDAEPDMIAAVNYAYQKIGKKIVLVGSSYSASLALKIATTNKKVSAVLAFSPGEYFGDKLNLKKAIAEMTVPVFVTSSKDESASVTGLISDIKPKIKVHFMPSGEGKHGSSALWKNNPNNQEYWEAVREFIMKL